MTTTTESSGLLETLTLIELPGDYCFSMLERMDALVAGKKVTCHPGSYFAKNLANTVEFHIPDRTMLLHHAKEAGPARELLRPLCRHPSLYLCHVFNALELVEEKLTYFPLELGFLLFKFGLGWIVVFVAEDNGDLLIDGFPVQEGPHWDPGFVVGIAAEND